MYIPRKQHLRQCGGCLLEVAWDGDREVGVYVIHIGGPQAVGQVMALGDAKTLAGAAQQCDQSWLGMIQLFDDRQGADVVEALCGCTGLPHFVAVGHILQASDMIATVPERFAQRVGAPFDLVSVPHPAALPPIAINMFWHARQHRTPASQWLRQLVAGLHGG